MKFFAARYDSSTLVILANTEADARAFIEGMLEDAPEELVEYTPSAPIVIGSTIHYGATDDENHVLLEGFGGPGVVADLERLCKEGFPMRAVPCSGDCHEDDAPPSEELLAIGDGFSVPPLKRGSGGQSN